MKKVSNKMAERKAERVFALQCSLHKDAERLIEEITLSNAIQKGKALRDLMDKMDSDEAEEYYTKAAKFQLFSIFKSNGVL